MLIFLMFPEIRGGTEETKELARKSKEALIKLFEGRKITLYNLNRDKYFRILADVAVRAFGKS